MNSLRRPHSAVVLATLAIAVCSTASSVSAANLLANPTFEAPPGSGSVDSTVAGWTLVEGAQRATFANHTPGGSRSIWLKTFQPLGGGAQQDVGITAGGSYLLSGFFLGEASYPTTEAVLFGQATWLNAGGTPVGTAARFEIQPASLDPVTQTNVWLPFSLNATSPAGAVTARILFGWEGGGAVTGAQSAFVDDVVFDGPGTPVQIDNNWAINGSGDWNVPSDWTSGSVPNGVGVAVNFLGIISSPRTVYTDTPITVGSIRFNNANTYVVTGAGSLTMDVASGSAAFNVEAGSHKINLPLRLNDNTIATVASGATLTIADPLTLANGSSLTKAGAGTLEIISTVTTLAPGALIVSAGTANLRTDVGTGTTINAAGGTTRAFATQRVAAVTVGNGGTLAIDSVGATRVVKTNALTVGASGKLDVGDNGVIVQYSGTSPLEAIRTSIISAYAGGAFTGNGIGTTALTTNRGIGYANSNQVGSPTAFLGESFTGTAVLVRYTLLADTNLDGDVDFDDLLALARAYGQTTGQRWVNADSNYDGDTDFDDLLALAKNYGQTAPTSATLEAAGGASFAADFALAQSLVPEPTSLTLLGLGAAAMLRRRR